MTLFRIFLISIPLTCGISHAADDWPTADQQKQVIKLLKEKNLLEEAAKDSVSFHWETVGGNHSRCNPQTGALENVATRESCGGLLGKRLSAEQALTNAREKAERFLNCNGQHGLYYASDPWMSRMYGLVQKGNSGPIRDCWRLIATDIKKGTRFLRVTNDSAVAEQLEAILGGQGCAKKLFEVIDHERVATPEERKCNEFKKKLLKDLGISGIRYKWEYPGGVPKLCDSSRMDDHAIILTDPDMLASSRVYTGYGGTSSSRNDDTVEERRAIQDLINGVYYPRTDTETVQAYWSDEQVKQGRRMSGKGYVPTRGQVPPETKAWMKRNLTNCQEGEPFVPMRNLPAAGAGEATLGPSIR